MKNSIRIGLHLGYWLLYGFLISFVFLLSQATSESALDDWEDWLAILLFTLLVGISSFYAFYGWLVPRYLTHRRVRRFLQAGFLISVGIALLSTVLVSLAATLVLYLALHQTQFILFSWRDQGILLAGFSLLALVNGLMGTLLRGALAWYADIHLKERVASRTLQTELALLKAQLNPHFLFNTLHNIDILIERDAKRASNYLNKLSDLLRFSLYETQAERIPLSHELASIEKYIELQKIRTPNEHYVTLQLEGPTEGLMIAPMLFIPYIENVIPYIENAFKYATNKKVSEAIRIRISVDEARIRFRCVNLIDARHPTPKGWGGLGQELLGQRLALLYPQRHSLLIEATDTTYSVDLTLPLHADALPAG